MKENDLVSVAEAGVFLVVFVSILVFTTVFLWPPVSFFLQKWNNYWSDDYATPIYNLDSYQFYYSTKINPNESSNLLEEECRNVALGYFKVGYDVDWEASTTAQDYTCGGIAKRSKV